MRILIADDHTLVRDGITSLLRAEGFDVVGEARDGLDAIEQVRTLQPDIVLMDISMPRMGGVDATRAVVAEHPYVRVVMLTVSDNEEDLILAIRAGACGYMLKDLHPPEFFESLRAVGRGESVVSRRLSGRLFDEVRAHTAPAEPSAPHLLLTLREQEVLRLIAGGLTGKEVARALHVSESAVKFHMRRILDKLELENRAQVVAWAIRNGLGPGETIATH